MIRVLLDEDIDVRLRLQFGSQFHVETVSYRGWQGKKNGTLLSLAQDAFDVLVSADKKLQFQQNIAEYSIALVVLSPRSKALAHLVELLPATISAIQELVPGCTWTGPRDRATGCLNGDVDEAQGPTFQPTDPRYRSTEIPPFRCDRRPAAS